MRHFKSKIALGVQYTPCDHEGLIIMDTAIADARISHVSQNLTKLRAFKLPVKMENFATRSLNTHNFVKF